MHEQHGLWTGAPPAPLDPSETPVAQDPASLAAELPCAPLPLSDNFRHSGWRAERERIHEAYRTLPVPYSRFVAFAQCGASHWILRNIEDPSIFRIVPDHCHDRFCLPCGAARQTIIRNTLADRLRDGAHRFLTLTIRSTGEPLADMIDHLYDSFRRLRSRRFWKLSVAGGAAFLEITWSDQYQSWHPHLHIMLEGRYMDLQVLKQLWLAVTGDSHAIHIRIIRHKPEVVRYVTKYATKPLPTNVIHQPELLKEAIPALSGRRMILPFGSWRAWKLLDDPADAGWKLYDHLNAVEHHALDGDTLCQNILSMLPTADPETGEFIAVDGGPAPDE